MRHSDYIVSDGAGVLAVSADTSFSDKFTACLVVDTPDDLLYALLDVLCGSLYIHAILLYARRPDSGSIARLKEYAACNDNKVRLFCYGDNDPEKDVPKCGHYKCPTYAQILNILAAHAKSRKLLFLEPRAALITRAIHALHEGMTTSAQCESGIFFPDVAEVKPVPLLTPERLLIENGLRLKRAGRAACRLIGKRSDYAALLHERACLPVFCFGVSQRYFWRLGGFDKRLKKAAALQDFCLSVCEAGGDIACCPQASIVCYADADTAKNGVRGYSTKDIYRIFDRRFRGMYRPGVQAAALLLHLCRRTSA